MNDYQRPEIVEANRRQLLSELLENCGRAGDGVCSLVTLKQIHSDTIHVAEELPPFASPMEGDGLISARPGMLLSIQTADCMPVLIADARRQIIAAVHAGWRGTLKRIVEKAVQRMRSQFSSDPADCIAVVGPSIRSCCYEVGEDVYAAFAAEFDNAQHFFHQLPPAAGTSSRSQASRKRFLDLPSAARQQLVAAGLQPGRIFADPPCTACSTDRFFSHRRDAGKSGRMLAVIGIAQPS